MIRNHLKIAFRALRNNYKYTLIHVVGLAVSLAASTLIFLWVWDEWSFDKMHTQGEHIYAVTARFDTMGDDFWRQAPAALSTIGKQQIPEIDATTRIKENGKQVLKYQNTRFEQETYHVDPSFFQLFDFPLLAGDRENPFPNKHSVILTENLVKRYFGGEDAIGKRLTVGEQEFEVTGIMADLPHNSSLQYEFLLPFEQLTESRKNIHQDWVNFDYEVFMLLHGSANTQKIAKTLTAIHVENNLQDKDAFDGFSYGLLPLYDIHLKAEYKKDQQVWIFLGVGIMILCIACINYLNLVTARASQRSREVGVRKVVGAKTKQLFAQFLYESVLLFLIASLLSLLLTFLLLPYYNDLAGKTMTLSLTDYKLWLIFAATFLITTLIAGIYPAWMLSKFQAAMALKGSVAKMGRGETFRKSLVTAQFASSVLLIVSTLVIRQQLQFMRQKDLGYQKENVFTFARHHIPDIDALKAELMNDPRILGVSVSSTSGLDNARSISTSIQWEGKPASMNSYLINQLSIDRDFLKVLQINMLEGAGFTGTAADSNYYLLNETAAKQIHAQVGMPIQHQGNDGTVAGIVKDFHFQDMKNKIGPMILFMDPAWGWDYIYVRTTGQHAANAIATVEKAWQKYNADYEFSYKFLDDSFDNQYREDIRVGLLFHVFAGIAIFISCLGLFGLVTYSAELKVKEIGIRKVLGASIASIMILITKDFFKLILYALVFAVPLAWWMMHHWLTNFAYRTEISWWMFVIAGALAFIIAILTVALKSLSAAHQNPVKSLRHE